MSLAKDKVNEGNKHHVVLDTTLDVSSSSDDSNIGRNNNDRLVIGDDMNDNNKQMSTSEKGELTSPPSHDSTVANNFSIMSTSIAKHNKMIDVQSSTTADDDKNTVNENKYYHIQYPLEGYE